MISNIINGYQTIPFTLKILRVRDYSITIPMLSRTKDKIEMKEPHYTSLAGRNLLVHGIEGMGWFRHPIYKWWFTQVCFSTLILKYLNGVGFNQTLLQLFINLKVRT